MIKSILIYYVLVEISSTLATGMPMILRLVMYIRIKKWIRENLPDTWKWRVWFILIEYRYFNITGEIKDKNNLNDMFPRLGYMMNNPLQYVPVKMSDKIYFQMKHRFGRPISWDDIIEKIKKTDSSFDPKKFKRDKQLDQLLK